VIDGDKVPGKRAKKYRRMSNVRSSQGLWLAGALVVLLAIGVPGCRRGPDEWLEKAATATDLEQREKLVRRAVRADPKHPQARVELASILRQQERYADAAKEMAVAAELQPSDAGIYTGLAWLQLKAGAYEQALNSSQRAAKLDPDMVRAYFTGGLAAIANGHAEPGMALYELGLETMRRGYPSKSEEERNEWMLQYQATLSDLREFAESKPDLEGALCALGRLEAYLGHNRKAKAAFEEHLRRFPEGELTPKVVESLKRVEGAVEEHQE